MKISTILLKKKKISGVHRTHDFVSPVRDWFVGLGVACAVLIGGSTYIAYDFHEQFIEPDEVTLTDETPLQYDEKKVHVWSEEFKERAYVFNELRNDKVIVISEVISNTDDPHEEVVPGIIEMQ